MANGNPIDLIFWANILAGGTLIFYAFFMALQIRGLFAPSPRVIKIIRSVCFVLLLTPVAARYQYSHATIVYLSAVIVIVGVLIKLKRKLGI